MIKATYDPLIDRKNLPNRSIDQIVEVVEKDTTCCALLVKKNTREIEVVQMMTPPHIVDSNPFIRLGSIGFSPELLGTKKQLPHAKMLHSVLMEHLASFHLWAKIPFEDSKLTILTTQNEYLPISDPILARKMLEAVGYVSDISVHESGTVLIQHSSKKYVEKMMLRQPNS
ncbi:hypothetical protein [Baia soyae]|nr:hypothetical protein [Baia soyae]